jgi:hypothetical protein
MKGRAEQRLQGHIIFTSLRAKLSKLRLDGLEVLLPEGVLVRLGGAVVRDPLGLVLCSEVSQLSCFYALVRASDAARRASQLESTCFGASQTVD